MTTTLTAKRLTIKGFTVKCTSQLKAEKFTFNPAEKLWEREVNVAENGDIYYGEFFQGSTESYAHHWECYAKQPLTITVE